jgi:hypothetical protein
MIRISFLGVRTILMQLILFAWFKNQFSTSSRTSSKIKIKVYKYNLEQHKVIDLGVGCDKFFLRAYLP